MASSIITSYTGVLGGMSTGLTRFVPLGSTCAEPDDSEVEQETPVRDAGTFSNLYTYVTSNGITADSTITLRKSQADTALTVTYASEQTGVKEDTANSVSFAATDEADYKIITGGTGTSLTVGVYSVQFDPTNTSNCISFLKVSDNGGTGFGSIVTSFWVPNSYQQANSNAEANMKYRVRNDMTSSDLYVYLVTNSSDGDTTFKTRVNGADGNQSVLYSATQTGAKEDSSNSDSLVVGDDYNYTMVRAGTTGTIALTGFSTTNTTADNVFPLITALHSGSAVSFNLTRYYGVSGTLNGNATEANTQTYPQFTFTAKELGAYVSANTIATSPTTVHLMDNGSASAVTVSYDAAQTGLKNDSVNTAEVTSGTDKIDYRVVTPNTSGSLTFRWIGMMGETAAAAVAAPTDLLMFMGAR